MNFSFDILGGLPIPEYKVIVTLLTAQGKVVDVIDEEDGEHVEIFIE